jgi:hypothetical protein
VVEHEAHALAVARHASHSLAEGGDPVGQAFVQDVGQHRAFEVTPEPFDQVEARRVWRQPVDLDPIAVLCEPLLDRLGGVESPVVADQQNLLAQVLRQQRHQKRQEGRTAFGFRHGVGQSARLVVHPSLDHPLLVLAGGRHFWAARLLKEWPATRKRLGPNDPLFPISGRVPGGTQRKTNKMIERDLMAARDKWIEEAKTEAEKKRRLKTDFLCYSNHDGLFADFHSRRHLFITSLERAGISPKMAQTLARHGDIRLTLGAAGEGWGRRRGYRAAAVGSSVAISHQRVMVGALQFGASRENSSRRQRAGTYAKRLAGIKALGVEKEKNSSSEMATWEDWVLCVRSIGQRAEDRRFPPEWGGRKGWAKRCPHGFSAL